MLQYNHVTDRRPQVKPIPEDRPRLAPYGRQPTKPRASPWMKALKWSGRGVLMCFALAGAIALGREGVQGLFGPSHIGPSTEASAAAPTQTPAVEAAPTPVDVQGPTYAAAGADAGPAASSAPAGPDFGAEKAAAEEELKSHLPETEGLTYRDVKTNLTTVNGQSTVDFCGEVNSLDPSGAQIGFQKFIAARDDARTELGAAPGEFSQAWQKRCTGAEGPKVWN